MPGEAVGAMAELVNLIGLDAVKKTADKLRKLIKFNEERKKQGLPVGDISTHCVFLGNPGTGKTTVARILGKIFKDLGILPQGQFIEVDKEALVAGYVGQTATKTKEIIDKAIGGILFIDEAYSLAGDSFGNEAIAQLLKRMEDQRGQFSVIVAGYDKEMKSFFDSNSGLRSRFQHYFQFEDYVPADLHRIATKLLKDKGYQISPEGDQKLRDVLTTIYENRDAAFANGRTVRELIETSIMNLAARFDDGFSVEQLSLVEADDIPGESKAKPKSKEEILADLNKLIGLTSVKGAISDLITFLDVQRKKQDAGLKADRIPLHSVFLGNPGTGKTTVARILADVFKSLGYIEKGHLVEVDSSDLIGGYVGQSEEKTKAILDKAMGGVLLIDEAYALAKSEFGKQAINIILKRMEDDRDKFVLIATGYEKEMEEFFATNTGLKSRFSRYFTFADYDPGQLLQIAQGIASDSQLNLTDDAKSEIAAIVQREYTNRKAGFGNARFVRQLLDEIKLAQSSRIMLLERAGNLVSLDMLQIVAPEDVRSTGYYSDASSGTPKRQQQNEIENEIFKICLKIPADLQTLFLRNIQSISYYIAMSDGNFSDEEAQFIRALFQNLSAKSSLFQPIANEMIDLPTTKRLLEEASKGNNGKMTVSLPNPERVSQDDLMLFKTALFRTGVLVAEAEGGINEQEKKALANLRKMVGLANK